MDPLGFLLLFIQQKPTENSLLCSGPQKHTIGESQWNDIDTYRSCAQ